MGEKQMVAIVSTDGESLEVDASDQSCLKHKFRAGDIIDIPKFKSSVIVKGVAVVPKGKKHAGKEVLWFELKDGTCTYYVPGNLREHGVSLMRSVGDESGWTTEALIDRFERDIIYDCHSYTARFERSKAMKELKKRGREALRPIIEHLKRKPPTNFMDLKCAWGHLLNWIEVRVDPDKSGPQDRRDTKGWMKWAEKFAA